MRKQLLWAPFLAVLSLSGCGIGSNTTIVSSASGTGSTRAAVVPTGMVHGGNQPVTDATIQLYAVGSAGYGSLPTPLLTTTVTTSDGTGTLNSNANAGNNYNTLPASGFTITGDYTCPASNPQVYLTAIGGNPGLISGTNNSAIFLVSALTDCNTLKGLGASESLNIDEVATVATAYALAHFIDPATGNIGSYSYSNQGLINAFATVGNIVSLSGGTAKTLTTNGNGLVPQQEINTLADILVPCVNSNLPTSSDCAALFAAAKPASGTAPTNVFSAAVDIALHPGHNVSTLFNLSTANAAFQPTLATPGPNDWTMALSFAGTGSGATNLAIDTSGSVWVAAYASGKSTSSLSRINNLGVNNFFDNGTTQAYSAYGVAIDLSGDAWVTINDSSAGGTYQFTPNGNSLAGPYSFTETSLPEGVAVDGNDDIFVTNSGSSSNSVSEMVQNGSPGDVSYISPNNTGFVGGDLSGPSAVAVDSQGNAWVANYNSGAGNSITQITRSQTVTGFTGGGLQAPLALAIDASNNVWVANYFAGSTAVSAFSSSGTPLAPSGFSGGGILNPISLAVDGANNIWIANGSASANSISELSSAGAALSPAGTGYEGGQVGNLNNPGAIGIDTSGNVWVGSRVATAISDSNGKASASITEFIGLATPTISPLSQAASMGQIGQAPGTPVPVTFVSTVLPFYTAGIPYYAQLVASGGNSGSFTYSVTTGAPPTGFTISASGGITGTSSVTGTTNVGVTVCDAISSTNCATQTFSFTASSSLPAGGSESTLSGRYVMRLGGFDQNVISNSGLVDGYAVVQSMIFDGAGNITAVSEDFNNPNNHTSLASSRSGTGYYTVGADHRGYMVITYPASNLTLEYSIAVGSLNGSSIAQDVRVIEFDDTKAAGSHPYGIASGEARLQSTTSLSTNQAYVFGFSGETPCITLNSNGCTNGSFTPYGAVTAVGRFYVDNANNVTSGIEDAAGNSITYNGITFTGTYTTPDSTGRGTMTLTPVGSIFPDAPANFVYYVVSPTELYMMSIDPHTTHSLLSGDVQAQTTAYTSSSLLTNNILAYESVPANGDGVSFYPDQSGVSLIYLTPTSGAQTVSAVIDEAGGSELKLGRQQGTFPYSIDSNGRLTIPGGGSTPVFYFASNSMAFATEQPSSDNPGDAGLLTLEGQSAGSFACPASGVMATIATVQPPVPFGVDSGVVSWMSAGSGALTLDNSDPSGVLSQDVSQSVQCTAADITPPNGTTGRFSFVTSGENSVGYALSPTRTVIITTSVGDTTPQVLIIQQ